MMDKNAGQTGPQGLLEASGPTRSPSWNILKKCLLVSSVAVVVMVIAAFFLTDVHGVMSVLFGSVLVVLFFGLSLFVGHLFSRRMPQAVMGIFVLTYFVKVIGFGAVLFALGTPGWLNKPWFAGAAVACVLLWQGTEVVIFSKQRFLLFDESASELPVKETGDSSRETEGVTHEEQEQ